MKGSPPAVSDTDPGQHIDAAFGTSAWFSARPSWRHRWRPMTPTCIRAVLLTLAFACSATAVHAADLPPRVPLFPADFEGATVAMVYVDLRDPTGAELDLPSLRDELATAFGMPAGSAFTITTADTGVQAIRGSSGVVSARWELYQSSIAGEVVVVLFVVYDPKAEPAPPSGWLLTGEAEQLPTLAQTDRALLRAQLNLRAGLFTEHNTWWSDAEAFIGGSPLYPDPAGPGGITWGETAVEAGIHGAAQLGTGRVYGFGNVTGIGAGSVGQDPWRSDSRFELELEQAYAGLLAVSPDSNLRFMTSYGQQRWQLNNGFLISRSSGGYNRAEWAASYLAPRTAFEQTFFATLRCSKFTVEAFLVDPQESYNTDSGTEYRGVNLQYLNQPGLEVGVAYYEVPESSSRYTLPDGTHAPREGLRTTNLRLASRSLAGFDGLEIEAELARQTHESLDMQADAWYVSLSYQMKAFSWQPVVTYRYAFFEGDDPTTTTYERFDAPMSGGTDKWVQGKVFRRAFGNSNLQSHRLRIFLAPAPKLGITLDYYWLWADHLNNRGGPRPLQELANRSYGQELDVSVRWRISKQLFLLGLAGIADPGPAIDNALPDGTDRWSTVQLSLSWKL